MNLKSIEFKDNELIILDQTKIPKSKEFIHCKNLDQVIDSIKKMNLRGAPLIAIAGLYGLVLELNSKNEYSFFLKRIEELKNSRPTAVNLKLALDEFINFIHDKFYEETEISILKQIALNFANEYYKKDLENNLSLSKFGSKLFSKKKKSLNILTHCNTGSLATSGHGTALGVIRTLRDKGFEITVFADETRPYQQGSRLTAFEMMEEKIEVYIVAEGMASWLMSTKKIDAVIVGADRISKNGDTANKIGTASLAIIAKEYKVPFYVACTETSFDFNLNSGKDIPIELRNSDELTENSFLKDEFGKNYIPKGTLSPTNAKALNPGFDITKAKYIKAIITEKGIISPVNLKEIKRVLK